MKKSEARDIYNQGVLQGFGKSVDRMSEMLDPDKRNNRDVKPLRVDEILIQVGHEDEMPVEVLHIIQRSEDGD